MSSNGTRRGRDPRPNSLTCKGRRVILYVRDVIDELEDLGKEPLPNGRTVPIHMTELMFDTKEWTATAREPIRAVVELLDDPSSMSRFVSTRAGLHAVVERRHRRRAVMESYTRQRSVASWAFEKGHFAAPRTRPRAR